MGISHSDGTHFNASLLKSWRTVEWEVGPPEHAGTNVIYNIVKPYTKGLYIGETGAGTYRRFYRHVADMRREKNDGCLFHKTLWEDGWWSVGVIPVAVLPENTTVGVRRLLEMQMILRWQPKWNSMGMQKNKRQRRSWGDAVVEINSRKIQGKFREFIRWRKRRESFI